jgi:hypothetical protein
MTENIYGFATGFVDMQSFCSMNFNVALQFRLRVIGYSLFNFETVYYYSHFQSLRRKFA